MLGIGINAVTRIVDITGAGQYTSIQTAVTSSSAGDTVLVHPGRYIENINVSVSNIAIISMEYASSDPSFIESTIIDGNLNAPGIRINQNVQNIRIQGFSITNSKSGIVLGQNSASIITNCALHGNASSYGGGINLFKGTTTLSGVRIFNNYAYIMAGGIYINGYMGTVNITFDLVNRCSIYNNTAGAGQDIVAHSINNDLSIPLDMFTVSNPTSYYAAALRASGNEFQLLIDAETSHHEEVNHDLYVSPTGDDANDGLSPATALKTIRTAVYRVASDSLNQKMVHILPGTYSRTANQQVFPIPLKSWVKVQGAGIEETQIVGEMDPAYASVQYNPLNVFTSFYQTHASLEDLSITAAGSNNSCAIWGFEEESLHLKNLRMHELSPDLNAVIHISRASNILWDEIIIEDFTTDSMGFLYSDGYITGVIRNSVLRNATSTFTSNEVWANPLIWIITRGEISFENCHFDNIEMMDDDSNIMTIGYSSTLPYNNRYRLVNCLFSNLQSHSRMMIMASPGYPEMDIVNCTFSGNTSDAYILMVNGNIRITNSVFYNNSPHEIAINSMPDSGESSTLTIDYSLFNGGYNGIQQAPGNMINYLNSNLDTDPIFSGGDDIHDPLYYSLSATSPCMNMGTPDTEGLELLPYDLAGNLRVWDGRIDMGCFEFGAPPVANDDPIAPDIPAVSMTVYPNPFSVFANIKVSTLNSGSDRPERVNNASVTIYNIKGQRVKTIILDPRKSGEQLVFWDGRDAENSRCSSGIYFVNLVVNGRNFSTRKVTFIR
jgi:hydrogenase maturation factor